MPSARSRGGAPIAAIGRPLFSSGRTWPRHWKGSDPRSILYYDAWYHVASVLLKQKDAVKARQTLMGMMRLSPSVGGADMKAKYEELIARTK